MVQTSAYNPAAAPADPYGLLEGGRKAISFATKDANGFTVHSPIGTSFTGIITGELRRAQIIDFETKQPKFWKDGRPQEQVIIDLLTDEREDELDDGIRTLYVKGQMLAELQEKLRATRHLGRLGAGSRLTITLIAYKDTGKGNPQKIYRIDVGPEFVPFVPVEQQQVSAALGYPQQGMAPQYAQPVQPVAQPYVQPAAPQYVPQQPPVQAAQPVAPQPVAPQPAAQPESPALAALNALAEPAPAQPVAPQPVQPVQGVAPQVTQEHVEAYKTITSAGIDAQTAIQTLTEKIGAGPDFAQQLAVAVGVQ